jgi:catechol 2,3-dioxygenase-like lactoylglutathione lyase family enzyme
MTPLTLDHIVIAVRDLDLATENYRRLLGRAASWRGRHPTYGTANVLFRLDNCYIELLAPTEDATDSPWQRSLCEHLDSAGEGLYALALGTEDVDATVAAVRERGLDALDPADGDGVDTDSGARREWRNARIPAEGTRGVPAFFIQHRSPPDALPDAVPFTNDGYVTAVDHTVVASSDLPASLSLWRDTLGLDLRHTLERPAREGASSGGRALHFLRLGYSILELAGETAPKRSGERDLLWGLAYRVDDVARTVERLRAEGVDISDLREGHAPDTIVADLKPGFSHDVRTLIIQKEAR